MNKRPFIYIIIPLILGIIAYYFMEINTYFVLIFLLIFLVVNIINIRYKKSIRMSLWILLFLLGVLLISFKEKSSQLIHYVDMPIDIRGEIAEIRSTSEKEGNYVLRVENLSEKLLLKVIGEKQLELGNKIKFNATLKESLRNTNPKLYNHKLNLQSENIFTKVTIKDYSIEKISEGDLSFLENLKRTFKDNVESIFDSFLIEDNSKLMKAIILGENSYLDEENIGSFRDLGLAHILAVSGLHIGILTVSLIGLLAFLGVNRRISVGLTLTIIWLYAYIIGNPSSIVRANIMFSLLLFSETWGEAYDSLNTLGFAIFIILIVNPYSLFHIGFQLSFIATFSIIYLTPRINQWFYSFENSWSRTLASLLAIQIGLLPIQAYYFNRIPLLTIVANIILIPLFTISLVLSMILIPVSFISLNISKSIAWLINFLLKLQYYGVELFNKFPYLTLKLPSPSIVGIVLYYILIFLLCSNIIIKANKRVLKALVFYLLLLLTINVTIHSLDESLQIQFIDVGQGDCILVKTQDGNYLIDTGGEIFGDFSIGEKIVLPYLEKIGVFKLKGVFISHYHEDHCKALPYLMDNMIVENIYLGYKREGNLLYEVIREKALEKETPIYILERGDRLKLDNNTKVLAMGPSEGILNGSRDNENDLSLVLLLNYYDKNILFTGDIEKAGEESLRENLNYNIDFLKVPHHGSKTSSTVKFLEEMNPRAGFVLVGRNNSFGHPHESVLERYEGKGIELYRTDQVGLISLTLYKENYNITPFIKEGFSVSYIVEEGMFYIFYFTFYFIISFILARYFRVLEKEMEQIEL